MPDIEKEKYVNRQKMIFDQYQRDVRKWRAKVLKVNENDVDRLWQRYLSRQSQRRLFISSDDGSKRKD